MPTIRERAYDRLPIVVQNALVSLHGRRILAERTGPESDRLNQFLLESEGWDQDRLRAYQEDHLRAIVAHAYRTVPHYRQIMDARRLKPEDVQTIDDLPRLPILERGVVAPAGGRLLSTAADRRRLREAHTGGTTGAPLVVLWDRAVTLMNHACLSRVRRWSGFQVARPYATLMGRPVVPVRQKGPPFWRTNGSCNQILFSSLHLKGENIPHYVAKLRGSRIEALEAYPSSAYVLARFLEAAGERLPLSSVVLSGEPLLPLERAVIEDRFQVKAFDAYSQTERVVFASECERHAGHHVFQEFGICEIVDADGAPVGPGTAGRIVGTGLHNFAMPLIRYSFGDMTTASDRRCACGRGLAMLEGFETRSEDILVTPDGTMVPPMLVIRGFELVHGLRAAQIVQQEPDEILVNLVLDRPPRADELEQLRAYLKTRLGPEVRARIERVEEIPLTSRGKFRRVISTVPLPWEKAATPNLRAKDPRPPTP